MAKITTLIARFKKGLQSSFHTFCEQRGFLVNLAKNKFIILNNLAQVRNKYSYVYLDIYIVMYVYTSNYLSIAIFIIYSMTSLQPCSSTSPSLQPYKLNFGHDLTAQRLGFF
jgi:hypothetical protein